jgi:hypothetical protein
MIPADTTDVDRPRRALVCLAVIAVGAYVYVGSLAVATPRVKGDGNGYYAYLPGVLLDHDTSFRRLVASDFPDPAALGPAGLTEQPSGRYLDKYSYGAALIAAPLFAVGHLVATASGQTATGYTGTEEFFAGLGALAAGLIGLLALRSFLGRRFNDEVVAVTLVAMALGTGLLHWMVYDPLYSHAYSFGAVAVLALAMTRFREDPASWSRAIALGLAIGIVILLRIPNIVIVGGLCLLGVDSRAALARRIAACRAHAGRIAAAAGCALLPLIPQEVIWGHATGHWLASPYVGEGFTWTDPHLEALYSWRPHGLLPYAPVLGLALIGLPILWRRERDLAWAALVAIVLDAYVICTWHQWDLGVAFGQRAFVDLVPILALPFAALISAAWPTRWRRPAIGLVTILTATTVLGMLAYWQGRLPHDGATPGNYVTVMLGGSLPGVSNAF